MHQINVTSHCLPEIGFAAMLVAFHFLGTRLCSGHSEGVCWPWLREQWRESKRHDRAECINVEQRGPDLGEH